MINLTLAICVYNAEKYIKETLQSIMAQTMQDFHLLIVNDCSTDGSVAIIEEFFAENQRQYELVNLPVNGGLSAGRRYVEEHAATKYIMFVDADAYRRFGGCNSCSYAKRNEGRRSFLFGY